MTGCMTTLKTATGTQAFLIARRGPSSTYLPGVHAVAHPMRKLGKRQLAARKASLK